HRRHEAVDQPSPQVREIYLLVEQLAGDGRQWGRGSRLKSDAHDGRAWWDDVDLRAGERADQLWPPADGAVDLDSAGRQVPLHVRICAGAVDPDSPHDAGQSRYGRTFHVLHRLIVALQRAFRGESGDLPREYRRPSRGVRGSLPPLVDQKRTAPRLVQFDHADVRRHRTARRAYNARVPSGAAGYGRFRGRSDLRVRPASS